MNALASGNCGARLLQDDGAVRTEAGLSVATRSNMCAEVTSGRRISMTTAVTSTLTKGAEFAKLEVKTSLVTDRADPRDGVITSTVVATACGAQLWSKAFTTRLTI